jgi:hypothetical protein
VTPDTEQIDALLLARLIGKPEDAVATAMNGAVPSATLGRTGNVMV